MDEQDLQKVSADRFLVAETLGLLLYGRKGPRFQAFRQAFLDGIEDEQTSRWVQPQGTGPRAVGYILGAVWNTKE